MDSVILTPSDFVAVFNQTLEVAYPSVIIEGELAEFRISKNLWLYFNLQDDQASVKFFGAIHQLPGPLEDGLKVRAVGSPHLHPRYGFSVNLISVVPVGEGSLKKAADLLAKKLESEGLFSSERKRLLPTLPQTVGLITAAGSAAAADFSKILNERWVGIEVLLYDAYVQGEQAPSSLVEAIQYFNRNARMPDVLVITRGGGSADDLAAFNDERVVRAVAASRTPTLVAIGHEVDLSLAELAADQRTSTPSSAAQLLVPDKKHILSELESSRSNLRKVVLANIRRQTQYLVESRGYLTSQVFLLLKNLQNQLNATRRLIHVFDPKVALKRGYAIVMKGRSHVNKVAQVKLGDKLDVQKR